MKRAFTSVEVKTWVIIRFRLGGEVAKRSRYRVTEGVAVRLRNRVEGRRPRSL